jgi:hypothetical protein
LAASAVCLTMSRTTSSLRAAGGIVIDMFNELNALSTYVVPADRGSRLHGWERRGTLADGRPSGNLRMVGSDLLIWFWWCGLTLTLHGSHWMLAVVDCQDDDLLLAFVTHGCYDDRNNP